MISNLLEQFVVDGWQGNLLYHKIVLVWDDRGVVKMLARNLDGNLVPYEAEYCKTVLRPPIWDELGRLNEGIEALACQGGDLTVEDRDERYKLLEEMRDKRQELIDECERVVAE